MLNRIINKIDGYAIVFILCLTLVTFLVGYPLVQLLGESFLSRGAFSLENYRLLFKDPDNYLALSRTLKVGVAVTLISTIIGVFFAWLVGKTDLPGKEAVKTGLILPYLVPPFIGAFSWTQLLGPVGYLNMLYRFVTGSKGELFNIYSPAGIIIVLAIHYYPLVYMTALGAFSRMDASLEEAARNMGASKWKVLRDITVPVAAPAIISGGLMVFVTSISNFGVPATLGFSSGYYVLTMRIYDAINNFSMPDHFAVASALAITLGLIAGVGLICAHLATRGKKYEIIGGKGSRPVTVSLGRYARPLLIFTAAFIFFFAVAPLLAVAVTSITRAYGLVPVPANWSLKHFTYILLHMPVAQRGLYNSLFLSIVAACLTVFFGWLIAYISQKSRWRGRFFLEYLATLPYAVPGTVLALAMILAFSRPLLFLEWSLYNTIWIILLAYVIRYLVFPVQTIKATLSQIGGSLEEAAKICGARQRRVLTDIVVPLSLPGITAGWFLVLIPSIHELTVSIILWSVGNETLGVAVFNLQEAGSIQATSALALLTVVIVLVIKKLAERMGKIDIKF